MENVRLTVNPFTAEAREYLKDLVERISQPYREQITSAILLNDLGNKILTDLKLQNEIFHALEEHFKERRPNEWLTSEEVPDERWRIKDYLPEHLAVLFKLHKSDLEGMQYTAKYYEIIRLQVIKRDFPVEEKR